MGSHLLAAPEPKYKWSVPIEMPSGYSESIVQTAVTDGKGGWVFELYYTHETGFFPSYSEFLWISASGKMVKIGTGDDSFGIAGFLPTKLIFYTTNTLRTYTRNGKFTEIDLDDVPGEIYLFHNGLTTNDPLGFPELISEDENGFNVLKTIRYIKF